jgi:hypothetical protein
MLGTLGATLPLKEQGVCHTMALLFTLKGVLRQKKNKETQIFHHATIENCFFLSLNLPLDPHDICIGYSSCSLCGPSFPLLLFDSLSLFTTSFCIIF